MKWNKCYLWLMISVILSLLLAAFPTYVGIKYNSQQEFYNTLTGDIDYGYIAIIYLSWFIPLVIGFLVIGFTSIGVHALIKKGKK